MPRHVFNIAGWNKTNMRPGRTPRTVRSREHMIAAGPFASNDVPHGGAFLVMPQSDDLGRLYWVEFDGSSVLMKRASEDLSEPVTTSVTISADRIPRVVTWALVDGLLFCSSPDFPTHYAVPGDRMWAATPEASEDTLLTALDIPQGICTEWAGRLVIASDDILYIADPLAPFTFTVLNAGDPPGGSIRGLHQVKGSLVCCTTTGVWALPLETAGRRDVLVSWTKISDHPTLQYGQTAAYDDVVYGITERGFASITASGVDVEVGQTEGHRYYGEFFVSPNFKANTRLLMVPGEGIALVADSLRATYMYWPRVGWGSWWFTWRPSGIGDNEPRWFLQAAVEASDGQLIWFKEGACEVYAGSRGSIADGSVYASMSGVVREHTVDRSPTLRRVEFATDLGGDGSVFLAVPGKDVQTGTPPAVGVVCGTSVWGGTDRLLPRELRSTSLHTSRRSDDVEIEIGMNQGDHELRLDITLDFHGAGEKRESN